MKNKATLSNNAKNQYELVLKEVNDSAYVISANSKYQVKDEDYLENNGMLVKNDYEGTENSLIKLHRQSGWIVEYYGNVITKGNYHIKKNPKMPDGMTVPISTHITFIVKDIK